VSKSIIYVFGTATELQAPLTTRLPTPLQMSKQYKSPTVTVHLNGRNFIGNEGGTAY